MRSKWKEPYCPKRIIDSLKVSDNIIINERNGTILPEFINKTVKIHSGKDYKKLLIKNEHIGHKFGEFALTKKSPVYKRK